ncbi:MAG: ABC transporter ATP-binding protein, partial [Clostridia bacterium]|nr:ABC transporter ATP-binding protein [Clostridia bacterium]
MTREKKKKDSILNLLKYAGKYKWPLIFCPMVMIGEVAMETYIPKLIQRLIDEAIPNSAQSGEMSQVLICGGLMIAMALISMGFGMAGSYLGAKGGMGFGRNLRQALFEKIQRFSFKNIDKFSTASLVTRITTDVNQTQNTLIMLVRMAFRSPIMFLMSLFYAWQMNPSLTSILFIAVPLLALGIVIIMRNAFPRFQIMMKKYDILNREVQENLIAIRVVKAFVRSAFEKKKFGDAADDVTGAQRSAEKVVLWNGPLMQILMYGCIVSVLWFGGQQIIRGEMGVGALLTFITYITHILMALMMLSFLFVSIVLSRASISR